MKRIYSATAGERGSSLVITLLVIIILSTILVAFMQSMSVERKTADSLKNIYQAQLAADAAASVAGENVRSLIASRPYYANGYVTNTNGSAIPIVLGSAAFNVAPVTNFMVSMPTNVSSPVFDTTNSTAMNVRANLTDQAGWMGSPITNGSFAYRSNQTMWVKVLRDPNKAENYTPTSSDYNPVIARYAYWIEDEASKVDYSVSGNTEGTSGAFARSYPDIRALSTNANNKIKDVDIGAIPLKNNAPLGAADATINKNIVEFFSGSSAAGDIPLKIRDQRALNRSSATLTNAYDNVKFYATSFGYSSELAGTGRRRVNINALVQNSLSATDIQNDVDDIIFAITGSHSWANAGRVFSGTINLTGTTRPLPDFGKRFFRNPVPTTDQENIYLRKLAANIRDYIDNDGKSQPTFIDNSGDVISGTSQTVSWLTGDEPQAIGKEAVPCLQEHSYYAREKSYSLVGTVATIHFTIDNYLEFYNPYTTDFIAPPGTHLKIYNRLPFDCGTLGTFTLPDIDMDISGMTFPAGQATVVTTSPDPADDPPGYLKGTTIRRLPVASNLRDFTRSGNAQFDMAPGSSLRGIRWQGRDSPFLTDYRTEMIMYDPQGVFDAFPFIGIGLSNSSSISSPPPRFYFSGQLVGNNSIYLYSASLRGNDSPSRTGDPRSLSEPLAQAAGSAGAFGNDQARFFSNTAAQSTMGLPTMSFVNPTTWPDPHEALVNSANNAYAFIRNGPMRSIGELGSIYDPHRKLDTNPGGPGADILKARGGARTLKIGQPDDLVTSTSRFTSASGSDVGWFNGAWRLCDIFSADDSSIILSDPIQRGKININGILRDDGVAFRALLRSLKFGPAPDAGPAALANVTLTDAQINDIVTQIKAYLAANGPMMDRGELGRIAFFSNANAATSGPNLAGAYDRTREEIFRRIIELITTRSASYSVYIIGEAVSQKSDGTIVTLTRKKKKQTFLLEPVFPTSNPTQAVSDYRVKVLYEGE